jgi:PST family polysaccharide transporter
MALWVVPHIAWNVHGTIISLRDILVAVSRPLLSGLVAAVFAFGVQFFCGPLLSPLPRLLLGGTVLLGVYVGMLLYVMGQKTVYANLMQGLWKSRSIDETAVASAYRAET